MKKNNFVLYISFSYLSLILLVSSCQKNGQSDTQQGKAKTDSNSTLKNLMEAYDVESNTSAKYEEYAKKADSEGYTQIASLFRATSLSESIHADNQAKFIENLGGRPKKDIKKHEIKTTIENLQDANKCDGYEAATMYPSFIDQAQKEKLADTLIKSLVAAKLAEVEHMKFYDDAVKNIEQWKVGERSFYVCKDCGYTVKEINFQKCTVCYASKNKYVEVK
jgi:rubrerythrin